MASQLTVAKRRQELYGPGRTVGREASKRVHQEDHISQNFLKGVESLNSKGAFESITARDFRHRPRTQTHPSRWDSSAQHSTHLHFGSDSSPLTSIVRSDYTAKPLTKFKIHVPQGLHDVHLADMAPRYVADKKFGNSTYYVDFDGEKSYEQWSSRMTQEGKKVGRRLKTTQFQKSTHFELGSDPDSLVSETSHCFTARQPSSTTIGVGQTEKDVDRSKSNVFRSGDYNASAATPKDHFLSIQKQDFPQNLPPAGISTATKRGYSHVIPSPKDQPMPAISALRRLLIEKNNEEFQNPRDPTAINVKKAFLKYDKDRSGRISIEELKVVCRDLGTPITEEEIAELLKDCDHNGDGQVDYVEFIHFLTTHASSQRSEEELTSTNRAAYSSRAHAAEFMAGDEDPFTGGNYQTKTHFQFGDEKGLPSSTYTKDFHSEANKLATKRSNPPVPPLSKVMHEFPEVASNTTTTRSDFVSHNVASMEETRLANLTTNRGRHKKLGVVLENTDINSNKDHYTDSIMTASYGNPRQVTGCLVLVKPDLKDYHHLESDRALTHPPKGPALSEVKQQFTVPLKDTQECITKRRNALDERRSRIGDSKQTHFFLGFDDSKPLSEKMVEYRERPLLDPKLPAAGISNKTTKGYSIIDHDSSESDVHTRQDGSSGLQNLLQQRNFLKNINPRDPLNVNLRKAFLEYDKDLSGTVSREEVKAVCKDMHMAVSDKDLEEMITRCDKSGEGQVDYHDFALHLSRRQQPSSDYYLSSTQRTDFKHPKDQSLSAMQKLVLEQDGRRYVPLQPSHFFHLDSGNDNLHSTTMKDFIKPEEQVA